LRFVACSRGQCGGCLWDSSLDLFREPADGLPGWVLALMAPHPGAAVSCGFRPSVVGSVLVPVWFLVSAARSPDSPVGAIFWARSGVPGDEGWSATPRSWRRSQLRTRGGLVQVTQSGESVRASAHHGWRRSCSSGVARAEVDVVGVDASSARLSLICASGHWPHWRVLRPGGTEQRGWVVQGDHLRSAHMLAQGCERFAG
jgi:hypothetical protein